jgi:SAM-dependent methyltransferase
MPLPNQTSPPSDPAQSRYIGKQGQAYHELKRAVPAETLPWVYRARATLFQPWICDDAKVLEFGCGYGWNLGALACRERVGCDVTEILQEPIEALGVRFLSSLTQADPETFDVVIAHHALEHVLEPARTLKDLHEKLRLGGKLLLSVPYEKERRYRRYNPDEPNHHLYSWNVQTLCALVETVGYTIVGCGLRRYGYDRWAAQRAYRFHLGERGFRLLRQTLQCVIPLQEIWLHGVRRSRSPE